MNNFEIKDVNNNVHKVCPRCGSDWELINNINFKYTICNKCKMTVTESYNDKYLLEINISEINSGKEYILSWRKNACQVEIYDFDIEISDIYLPLLPFNITLEKLKTYLLFN